MSRFAAPPTRPRSASEPPEEKLRGYRDFARDAVDRAARLDEQAVTERQAAGPGAGGGNGQQRQHRERQLLQRAAALYRMGLEACREGLALPRPAGGQAAAWRRDLEKWGAAVEARLREISAEEDKGRPGGGAAGGDGGGGSSGGGGGGGAVSRAAAAVAAVVKGAVSSVGGAAPRPSASARGPSPPPASTARRVPSPTRRSAGVTAATAATVAAAAPPSSRPRAPSPSSAAAAAAPRPGASPPPARPKADSSSSEAERLRRLVLDEALETRPTTTFDDVAGLALAKQALREAVVLPALRPDLFRGLRSPARGVLLYGPPGNGKTMLCRALAAECKAEFFSISAASLTSKWLGESEKLVRALFSAARERAPSVVFFDEIDSLCGARGGASEHEASRRLKTELLVQMDGLATGKGGEGGGAGGGGGAAAAQEDERRRVVVVGATNRPADLDDAVRRRLIKRIYVPLPDAEGRAAILRRLLRSSGGGVGTATATGATTASFSSAFSASSSSSSPSRGGLISSADLARVVAATDGYSASDLTALAKEAALAPLRELSSTALARVRPEEVRPLRLKDFSEALRAVRPSVAPSQLAYFEAFTRDFGAV